MKLFCVLSLFLVSIFSYGQYSITDSISGGSFSINSSEALSSFVNSANSIVCPKPKPIPPKPPINNDPCANVSKILGYKIQIKYSKDRSVILNEMENFLKQFPGLEAEMAYSQPDYRLLVGDYFTKRSAALDLGRIKRRYPSSFLIQWRVYCNKAE